MGIHCELFLLNTKIEGCFGDFVDNVNSNKSADNVSICIIDNIGDAESIASMFGRDCDLYSSDCGVDLDGLLNSNKWIIKVGVNDCHLLNLRLLRDLVAADWTISPDKIAKARALTIN